MEKAQLILDMLKGYASTMDKVWLHKQLCILENEIKIGYIEIEIKDIENNQTSITKKLKDIEDTFENS